MWDFPAVPEYQTVIPNHHTRLGIFKLVIYINMLYICYIYMLCIYIYIYVWGTHSHIQLKIVELH